MTTPYVPAMRAASSCQPGAVALRTALAERGLKTGCFSIRNIIGSTTTLSLHAEGRAIDAMGQVGTTAGATVDEIVAALHHDPDNAGVQCIIRNRQIWKCDRDPIGTWRPYTGSAGPHTDHAHIELTWDAALRADVSHWRRYTTHLTAGGDPTSPPNEEDPMVLRTTSGVPSARNPGRYVSAEVTDGTLHIISGGVKLADWAEERTSFRLAEYPWIVGAPWYLGAAPAGCITLTTVTGDGDHPSYTFEIVP